MVTSSVPTRKNAFWWLTGWPEKSHWRNSPVKSESRRRVRKSQTGINNNSHRYNQQLDLNYWGDGEHNLLLKSGIFRRKLLRHEVTQHKYFMYLYEQWIFFHFQQKQMQQKHQQKSQQSSSSGSLSSGSMPTPHQHLDKQAGKQRVGTSRPITPLGKMRVSPSVPKCIFSLKEKFQRVATALQSGRNLPVRVYRRRLESSQTLTKADLPPNHHLLATWNRYCHLFPTMFWAIAKKSLNKQLIFKFPVIIFFNELGCFKILKIKLFSVND